MIKIKNGFTLIELMITITVASILLTVAVPSFFSLIQNNRMTATANSLVSALNFARSEAVRRGREVVVCNTNATATACVNTGEWNSGWIIWFDEDNDGNVPAVGNQYDMEVLRVETDIANNLSLTKQNRAANSFTYTATGVIDANNNDTIELSDSAQDNEQLRCIDISVTGRVSVVKLDLGVAACP